MAARTNDKPPRSRAALTRRRTCLALPMALSLAALGLPAQAAAPDIRSLGVFSLLGETLQLVFAGEATDSRLDRNLRESLNTKDVGFDQAALRAVRQVMGTQYPRARLQLFRATQPLAPAEQRALADGATRAELPAWIVNTIQSGQLSHLLIITRHRGDASFPVSDGFSIGRGGVEGIGYYLDNSTELKNLSTGKPSIGFLGSYAMVRVQLLDAQSGDVLGSQDVRVGQIHAGRNDEEVANIWNALSPAEKVEVLRTLVEKNVARVLPAVLGKG